MKSPAPSPVGVMTVAAGAASLEHRAGGETEVMMVRIAIVTGAASGIGQALASALVARGDTVVVADVDKNRR